jgi:hypothetical protein
MSYVSGFRSCVVHWCIALLLVSPFGSAVTAEDIQYSTQIAPILQKYCAGCHNRADAANAFSVQSPAELRRGGENGAVLDPKTPENSRLLAVVSSRGDDQMPPADQAQLSPDELATLTAWIRSGCAFDSEMAIRSPLPKVPITAANVRAPALSMAFHPDEGHLLVGKFRNVEQLEAESWTTKWTTPVADGKVNSVRISKDGQRVLLGTGIPGISGRAIEVTIGGSPTGREFTGHYDIIYDAVWSPDESIVATAGYDRRIILHDARNGTLIRELKGHNGAVFDLEFSPDGTLLASASADATIKIWHVSTGERFDTLSQPQSEQYSVTFSPDGSYVYASGGDSRIRQWKVVSRSGPQINPLLISRFAHEGAIARMQISPDGRYLATAAENRELKIWDTSTVTELAAHRTSTGSIMALAFQPGNQKLWAAESTGNLRTFDLPAIDQSTAVTAAMTTVMSGSPSGSLQEISETEPNDQPAEAQVVPFLAAISGVIDAESSDNAAAADSDCFRFTAQQRTPVLIEVNADRDKSPLDSLVEVFDLNGRQVLQVQLQAVRDSYFTFRGKDSDTADDFRMFNWQEMELNEYLYADGEVVKLWLYPRGPDSGFKVYPGFGNRQTYFGTTPSAHPLQGPAFIVTPFSATAELKDTGLPVFPVYAENDDDPMRQWGRDSRLMFLPPADGEFIVRIRDARGFQGSDYRYRLLIRSPAPDFSVAMSSAELNVFRGTGKEVVFTATRLDGYDGPIEISAENLPAGFTLSDPVVIEPEQRQAMATLIASSDATPPSDVDVAKVIFKAKAEIGDQVVIHDIGGLKSLKLSDNPKVTVRIVNVEQHQAGLSDHTPELTVWAGETIRAIMKVDRKDHEGLVEFGKEDSGRNLPHGVFVDNIGLNGLMLLQGQNEREFFITAAKWVPETSRPFYLKSNVEGGITSKPVLIHVRHRNESAKSAVQAGE